MTKIYFNIYFSNSLTIHEQKKKEMSAVDDVWKSQEDIT